jgi:hypothetical protein
MKKVGAKLSLGGTILHAQTKKFMNPNSKKKINHLHKLEEAKGN